MTRKWFGGSKPESVEDLVVRKKFGRAAELLQAELGRRRGDPRVRLQLADVLVRAGRAAEAAPHFVTLADEYAIEGHSAKAVAMLKRLEAVAPGRADVSERLAFLLREKDQAARSARVEAAGGSGRRPAAVDESEELDLGRELDIDLGAAGDSGAIDLPSGDAASGEEQQAFFSGFGEQELLALLDGLKLSAFEPGDVIVTEGEPGDSLFVITSGLVKAWVRNAAGRNVAIRAMGEGEFFGEIALLNGTPRSATVTACQPSELLVLDRPTLASLSAAHPQVAVALRDFANRRAGSGDETRARSSG